LRSWRSRPARGTWSASWSTPRHQRAGIGRRAVELLVDELRGAGWRSLETSFVPGTGGDAGFWRRCGFRATGRELHGEPVVVREF